MRLPRGCSGGSLDQWFCRMLAGRQRSGGERQSQKNGSKDPPLRLMSLAEPAEADAQLDGVNARVGFGHTGVGDVLETNFGADIVFALQEVQAQRAAGGEVNLRGARRSFHVGEEGTAADFEVRGHVARLGENPFESEGVDAASASGAVFLRDAVKR